MAESVVFDRYRELWRAQYAVPCSLLLSPLDYGKLGIHLESGITEAQLLDALDGYFLTDDPFVKKRKHPLGLFLVQPTRYLPERRRYQRSCPHSPTCPNMRACCVKQDQEREA